MQSSNLSGGEYAEVMSLYARYNHASDAGDLDGFAACFTVGATLVNAYAGFEAHGHEELKAMKRKAATPSGEYRRHWNSNIDLEKVAPDHIRGRCYLLVWGGKCGDEPRMLISGVYEDDLSLTHGAWKFSKRQLHVDWGRF